MDPMPADALDELLEVPPFAQERPPDALLATAAACLDVLRQRFPRYAEFLARDGASRSVTTFADLDRLPAIFLPVLKSYQFPLPPDLSVERRLTSSGTTGSPSVTPLDAPSWRRRVRAMRESYLALGLLEGELTALAFLMEPATTQMAGSVVIDAVLRSVPQVRAVHYLARMTPSGPQFAAEEVGALLGRAVRAGPVVLVGYPALMAAAVTGLSRAGMSRLPLPPGSRILTGGGWKSFLPGVRLEQEEFRRQASAFFGVPPQSIRDMFGLSECPAVFVQCEAGRYHVPAWCWAQAVDPEFGCEVALGEEGLLRLTVPLTTSYPLLRILTTDRVAMGQGCPCGRAARFLVPHGRVSAARFETCAMKIGRAVS
jgi:phenylacetate-coenzyme A ligase PaaK-like adenylate-forming protein